MKILHIDVSAIRDKFYLYLFSLFKQRGMEQCVYTPFKKEEYSSAELEWAFTEYSREDINFIAAPIKKKSDRVLYKKKIAKYFRYLDENYDLKSTDIIHAHSLYSDGGVAYHCYKKYGIPYVVAVRSTDIEFMTVFPFLNEFIRDVLRCAAKIVYLSRDLKNDTINKVFSDGKHKYNDLEKKSAIIPNGVNNFWIENLYQGERKLKDNCLRIIQVSRLEKRKKVDKAILAIKELIHDGYDCTLTVVGDGSQKDKLNDLVRRQGLQEKVKFTGFISDKKELLKLYRDSDIFCMTSKGETFGIVYVEAMTQGLPVIGLSGTGVSGYFRDKEVGCFINDCDPKEIAQNVRSIIPNYETISVSCVNRAKEFNWADIIDQYISIYSLAV